jgi:hypothetical protein
MNIHQHISLFTVGWSTGYTVESTFNQPQEVRPGTEIILQEVTSTGQGLRYLTGRTMRASVVAATAHNQKPGYVALLLRVFAKIDAPEEMSLLNRRRTDIGYAEPAHG